MKLDVEKTAEGRDLIKERKKKSQIGGYNHTNQRSKLRNNN